VVGAVAMAKRPVMPKSSAAVGSHQKGNSDLQQQRITRPVRTIFYIQIEYQRASWLTRLFCPWFGKDWRSYYPNDDENGSIIDVSDENLLFFFEEAKIACSDLSLEEGRQFRLTGRWRIVRRAFYRNIPLVDTDILIGKWAPPTRNWFKLEKNLDI
jgi:hypothetical protein